MNNTVLILFLFSLFIIPIASADMIAPGTHQVNINNEITNINEFPDYVFISGCELGLSERSLELIPNTGEIPEYYKFCSVSVYAIEKSKFNQTLFTELNEQKNATEFLQNSEAKKVLKNIKSSTSLLDINPTLSIKNQYTIDLSIIKDKPNSQIKEKDSSFYFYILIPIIALILIILILIKRRK